METVAFAKEYMANIKDALAIEAELTGNSAVSIIADMDLMSGTDRDAVADVLINGNTKNDDYDCVMHALAAYALESVAKEYQQIMVEHA